MTKKDFDTLNKYRRNLKLAVNSDCFSGLYYSEVVALTEIYNKLYNDKKKPTSCNRCILNMLKRLGKDYLEYEATHQQITEKKRGRKKKCATKQ